MYFWRKVWFAEYLFCLLEWLLYHWLVVYRVKKVVQVSRYMNAVHEIMIRPHR